MPSLSNIPGFTALSTSPDPHAAWPDQAGSYNVPGDGTTPLENPTSSDGNKTGFCSPDSIYVGRGRNASGSNIYVKGNTQIVCYACWSGHATQSSGWPYNYQVDVYNQADKMYVFNINTSTGAISLINENLRPSMNLSRGYNRGLNMRRNQYWTSPGFGSMISTGYSSQSNGWQFNNIPDSTNDLKGWVLTNQGTSFSAQNTSSNSDYNFNSWQISHLPRTTGSYDNVFAHGVFDASRSWPYGGYLYYGYQNETGGLQWANSSYQVNGQTPKLTQIFCSQPDGAAGGNGDINGILWGTGSSNYVHTLSQRGCGGNGGSTDVQNWNISETDWNTNNGDAVVGYGGTISYQRSGSTYGVWRKDTGLNQNRLLTTVSTKIWDVNPKSWYIPPNLAHGYNANSVAGICNDLWFGGINSSSGVPFYYYNDKQEGYPMVKWEIDDTTGAKIVGSVMPPIFDIEGNNAISNSNNSNGNVKQHIFPIWNGTSDSEPSWIVIVYWGGGGDSSSSGTLKGQPGRTQPMLRCYPWPTFTTQNIAVGS